MLLNIFSTRYLLAIAAGLLLACAFPKTGVAGLAWIAPGFLLFAARGKSGGESFRLGYVAGLAHFLATLYWLLLIPFRWNGIPIGPAIGWMALSAYLALYPAIWVWLSNKFRISKDVPKDVSAGSTWLNRNLWAFACAGTWVALEMIRARFLTGFPWNPLGASQYKLVPLLQISSFTGVYGVSFLLVWFSASLLNCVERLIQKPEFRRAWIGEILLPVAVVAAIWFWGFNRAIQSEHKRPGLKVALIQPSIEQEMIWDETKNAERFNKLMKLSLEALKEKPNLLIWPEAAMPDFSRENFSAITNMIATHHVWMIFGADDAEVRDDGADYFNSAFLFSPEGEYLSNYHKRRLVMFGEYLPFSDQLPFLKKLIPIGNFTPGKKTVQFQLTEPRVKTSVLICFEDVFPHYAREHVENDTDFLLNLTNDGWFGNSAAQWQQAAAAVFRAVENGLPLVRCTNNGLTCWIDEFGRLREMYRNNSGNVYSDGFLIASIPLLTPGEKRAATFYNQHGDWFGWGCVAAMGIVMGWIGRRCRSKARPSEK